MSGLRAYLGRYSVATDPLRTERRVELVAVILTMVLCLQLLYSGARFALVSMPEAIAPAADALIVKKIQPADRVSAGQSEDILGRPLFWESRRPLETSPGAVKKKRSTGKAVALKGIKLRGVFGAGETAGIIISSGDKQRRVLLGEALGEWTLESVQANEVILSSGDRLEKLQLRTVPVIAAAPPPVSEVSGPAAPARQPQSQPKLKPPESSESGEAELSLGGARLSLGGGPGK